MSLCEQMLGYRESGSGLDTRESGLGLDTVQVCTLRTSNPNLSEQQKKLLQALQDSLDLDRDGHPSFLLTIQPNKNRSVICFRDIENGLSWPELPDDVYPEVFIKGLNLVLSSNPQVYQMALSFTLKAQKVIQDPFARIKLVKMLGRAEEQGADLTAAALDEVWQIL